MAVSVVDLTLPYLYEPRAYQEPFWRYMASEGPRKRRRAVKVWHRRAGKDLDTWNWMIYAAAVERPGTYYYFFPTYAQARKILWEGRDATGRRFLDYVPPALLLEKPNETDLRVEIRHKDGGSSAIWLIGVDKFDSIVGTGPVGVAFSEYAIMDPKAWHLTRPMLLENDGWAVFCYTPRGRNHGWTLWSMAQQCPSWYTSLLDVTQTQRADGSRIVTDLDIQGEREEGMSEELIQQEYFCSFSGSHDGAYYSKDIELAEQQGRIGEVPWMPEYPVITGHDIGVDDAHAIWCVQQPTQSNAIHVIEYMEFQGEGLPQIVRELNNLRPYVYREHLFPHDFAVREWGTGRTRSQQAYTQGLRPTRTVPKMDPAEGIAAVRSLLPRMYWDKVKCKRGLQALASYTKQYDEEFRVFRSKPLHNWASNGADAKRTLALGLREIRKEWDGERTRATVQSDFDVFEDGFADRKRTADSLW
jgi:hypothetical protein